MTFDDWWAFNVLEIKALYRETWNTSRNDALKEWLRSERKIPKKLPMAK